MTHTLDFSSCLPIRSQRLPTFAGIYCVLADDSSHTAPPIYIGKAGDISDRISQHIGDNEEMDEWMQEARKINPSVLHLYVSCVRLDDDGKRCVVEPALVCRLQPSCNKNYKEQFPENRPSTSIEMEGPVHILNDKFTVEPGQQCS